MLDPEVRHLPLVHINGGHHLVMELLQIIIQTVPQHPTPQLFQLRSQSFCLGKFIQIVDGILVCLDRVGVLRQQSAMFFVLLVILRQPLALCASGDVGILDQLLQLCYLGVDY